MELSNALVLILFSIFCLALLGWIFLSRLRASVQDKRDDSSLLLLQQQIEQLRAQFSQVLGSNAQSMQRQIGQVLEHVNDRLKENTQVLNAMQQSLGERLDHAARVVGHVPRSLGGLGEFFLEDLLGQILPPQHFSTQYSFRGGDKVDAVIKLGASLVPVDAKFPPENFKRILEANDDDRARARKQFTADVRKHIEAIATKYILPDEGTYDFALMYIPAENVYYEAMIKDGAPEEKTLSSYAMSKRVIPVSPNRFYAYLQAIVLGLKGMKIEDRAKDILHYLSRLQGDFGKFRDEFALLGEHLGHAQSGYQNADRRLEQFAQKLLSADADPAELFDPPPATKAS